ncbi:MAG: NADH-quinone oxidoreductase subunit N [SAR202 cluster bacterium]|nr:NADH-quinone oxidoreductase subunit N [SAR202 cluster bacterium]
MSTVTENLYLLTPEFLLAALALLVFALDLVLPESRKTWLAWIGMAGLTALAIFSVRMLAGRTESLYGGLLAVDQFSLFFKVFFMGLGVFIILSSVDFVKQHLSHPGEFYGILLFSILGMNMMAQARELVTAYIALELLSFSLYVLTAYARGNPKSNEAALKYIIIGAFSTAVLLYGISMIYSVAGSTHFDALAETLSSPGQAGPVLWVGVAFLVAGLGFKLAAVPFHMWAPDVYEGAPLPVTAYLAIASKAGAAALALRLISEGLVPAREVWPHWQIILAALAAASMLVGNLVALAQRNLKRLMAYSSIGHVGYLLAGMAALNIGGGMAANGIIFYLVGYAATSLVVFAALISFFNQTGQEEIADLAGLADRQPLLAAAIAIGLFSLAGLPIFAGFTIKFYLFAAVAQGGFLWLAGLAIFSSLISLYYYLQVIRQMYIQPVPGTAPDASGHGEEPSHTASHGQAVAGHASETAAAALRTPTGMLLAVVVAGLVAVLALGVYPGPLLEAIERASQVILPGI